MRKNKYNPELLKEEIKRAQSLMEFTFPVSKEDYEDDLNKNVILGSMDEADDMSAETDAIAKDLGVDQDAAAPAPDMNAPAAPAPDMNTPADPNAAPAPDMSAPTPDMAEPAPDMGAPAAEMDSETEEIDVTSIVTGTEEAKNAAENASNTSEMLLQKLADLEARLGNMDKVTDKIDALEKEMVKRNPTPLEKLEMRSLDSYPFNQKLTDYWAEKEGAYDVMNTDKEKEEYVLTNDDIDSQYNDVDVRKSFDIEDNPYEEEEI
jgi:hypothetical protein